VATDKFDLRSWRKGLGLTQAEAAAALGLDRSTILNYEAGKRRGGGGAVRIPRHVELACERLSETLPAK
jgi:transcriptional regulator with XRE-family HTH domain